MAKEKEERKLLSEERTDTVIYDSRSREELRLSLTRRESEDDDGTEFYETEADNIECGDGTVISSRHLMLPPNQGGVTLQRCDMCREESKPTLFRKGRNINQFSPAANIRRCFYCSKNLCTRHTYIFDNHIACKRCKKKQSFRQKILRPIFFRRVKES